MYQPYPTGGQQPMTPVPAEPPQSVRRAVNLMYAGAAVSVVGLIIEVFTVGSLKSAIRSSNSNLTASQIHSVEIGTIVFEVVIGLIGVGLWIWMARMNLAGRSWARILASVLFGLSTLSLLSTIVRPNSAVTVIYEVVVWLVGLGAIWMLWQRESSAYIKASSSRVS